MARPASTRAVRRSRYRRSRRRECAGRTAAMRVGFTISRGVSCRVSSGGNRQAAPRDRHSDLLAGGACLPFHRCRRACRSFPSRCVQRVARRGWLLRSGTACGLVSAPRAPAVWQNGTPPPCTSTLQLYSTQERVGSWPRPWRPLARVLVISGRLSVAERKISRPETLSVCRPPSPRLLQYSSVRVQAHAGTPTRYHGTAVKRTDQTDTVKPY